MESGLSLSYPLKYRISSMRFFNENERHVNRRFGFDVLILMLGGVLHFTEDGEDISLSQGEYYIQRHGLLQEGRIPSEHPKYFYIEFLGEWTENAPFLKKRGSFSEYDIMPDIKNLERAQGSDMPNVIKTGIFYGIVTKLFRVQPTSPSEELARNMAADMSEHLSEKLTLEQFCVKYNYTKNTLIKIFSDFYGVTPMKYLSQLRINKAKALMEASDTSMENIAEECGFSDYSHMYKTFVKAEKASPAAYKRFTEH